jgi:tetratricopeptide (TPR) repeat protein
LEKQPDRQTGTESKARLVEQINACLGSGDYSRALDSLRAAAAEFPDDTELSELEKLARDGTDRNVEANRLITESQELFAHRKSAEAIQLLREAYALDKNNSRARAILANALVEHAISIVETDWWEAGLLAKQALELNPAHPTAKTIRSLIGDLKKASPVEEWISQVSKVQASGDLFAALSLIAEGLDIRSHDSRLLLLQDAIQRDQDAQRRHARRGDLEDLRRMEREIDRATDSTSKKALGERIQALAAKYWTDGEVISVANGLLRRLGLVSQESASPRGQRAPVIFHVPRPSAPEASPATAIPPPPSEAPPSETESSAARPDKLPARNVPPVKVAITPQEPTPSPVQAAAIPGAVTPALAAKVTSPSHPKQPAGSHSTTLVVVAAAAIILVSATLLFTRKHYAPPVAKTPEAAPAPSAPAFSTPPPTTAEPLQQSSPPSSDSTTAKVADDQPRTDHAKIDQPPPANQPPAEPAHTLGTLLVVAGQDGAQVFLNGKLQPQRTQAGQLRLPDLDLKDYVVGVSKTGFQDPPQQKIRIRKGEQARLIFNLQPQPQPQSHSASLTIQGGTPGASVFVDQTPVGAVQPDGSLSVSAVPPGDHTVELRKDRFKPRQVKKHFVVGGTVSLAAADAALEAAPSELKITFSPPDASVAIVKGDLLKMVTSGVPLNLPPGTYTLTARTAERITRTSTFEIVPGQSKTLDLSLAPNGMSKWEDPAAWKNEKDSFVHKGGDFVLYGVAPASGTFVFSAMIARGHFLQWVLNYTDPKNYVLFQMDDNNFYRTVIRNGEKASEFIVPDKSDKKSFRTLQIRVSPTELVHQIKHGDRWTVLDRWTQPGINLSLGKFGFYIPGSDQVALSSFAHYVDLNLR